MRQLTQKEIRILQLHAKWLAGEEGGEKANLRHANLSGADLRHANLRHANLRGANLRHADLRGADLRYANLSGANLRHADLRGADLRHANLSGADMSEADMSEANLRGANLRHANLRHANLRGANLRHADLRGADLDFSCWPLHCGSTQAKADDRLFAQLLFHLTRLDVSQCSGGVRESMNHLRSMAAADLFCEYRDDLLRLEE